MFFLSPQGGARVHTLQTELKMLEFGESVTLVHYFQNRAFQGLV